MDGATDWLDRVMAVIAATFSDLFTMSKGPREEETHEKHGRCIRCTYRVTFLDSLPAGTANLPHEQGDRLMRMIKHASKKAKGGLVDTVVNRQHDFADWGWTGDNTAEMWIFLKEGSENGEESSDGENRAGGSGTLNVLV